VTFADALVGRRERRRARADLVRGAVGARLAFELELDSRAAAIAYRPPATPGFDALLAGVAEDTGARIVRRGDGFGLRWIVVSGVELDDLALSIGVLAESLQRAGCWEQVVCAVFAFRKALNPAVRVYWIYNFERGTFYAFVPREDGSRDSTEEARLAAAVERDIRLERDARCRYPLWGIPL
jgi:hypothetical protein